MIYGCDDLITQIIYYYITWYKQITTCSQSLTVSQLTGSLLVYSRNYWVMSSCLMNGCP